MYTVDQGHGVPLLPPQASTFALNVDLLGLYLLGVSIFFTVGITVAIVYFSIKYRRRPGNRTSHYVHGNLLLELTWSVIPLAMCGVMFFWGASIYYQQKRPPKNAIDVSVMGKKWMWKFQHTSGKKEINYLHVPVNRPVRLTMSSEDVIHSMYLPAFRTHQDVLPGRYTTTWFEATKPGVYHLFCNQYCGTQHSRMIGSVIVMRQEEYARWLAGSDGNLSPVESGKALFEKLACNTCHMAEALSRGPNLENVFGSKVQLANGQIVLADENYIRESILMPQSKIVAGYEQVAMPTFQGLVTEEQLNHLVAYIKSLSEEGAPQEFVPDDVPPADAPAEPPAGESPLAAEEGAPADSAPAPAPADEPTTDTVSD